MTYTEQTLSLVRDFVSRLRPNPYHDLFFNSIDTPETLRMRITFPSLPPPTYTIDGKVISVSYFSPLVLPIDADEWTIKNWIHFRPADAMKLVGMTDIAKKLNAYRDDPSYVLEVERVRKEVDEMVKNKIDEHRRGGVLYEDGGVWLVGSFYTMEQHDEMMKKKANGVFFDPREWNGIPYAEKMKI
jgi:hypothetical protein